MRKQHLAFTWLPLAAGLVCAAACSSNGNGAGPASSDAGQEGEASPVDATQDQGPPPPPKEAGPPPCLINPTGSQTGAGGSDPVELCTQQSVLTFMQQYAYETGQGVAPGWGSQMPYAASGTPALMDNLGLAADVGLYHCSANYYGGPGSTSFDALLPDLAKVLAGELAPAPSDYDGELYFRLRGAYLAFTYVSDANDAASMEASADTYARQIASEFTTTVPLPASAGASDAGGSGDASEDGSGDATTGEGGSSDAGAATMVALIGAATGSGAVAYEPAKSAMAAAALLDAALRETSLGEGGADVPTWIATAAGTLEYLHARARDPGTGLFYHSLVTSSDPGHDALAAGTYANDELLTDVQGWVVLALARAQDAYTALGKTIDGGLPAAPYARWGSDAVASMTAANLFDGETMQPVDAAACPPQVVECAPPGAFLEGLVPSLGTTIANKPVTGNAILLGGFARVGALTGSKLAYENNGIRWALSQSQPNGDVWSPDRSFLSVVTDANGDVVQQAYLRATSRDWHFARAFSPSGADAGTEPDAASYSTAASLAMIEGISELWVGFQNGPACAF